MILVTGGTGLVGAHLLYRLTSSNKNVRAIYRSDATLERVKKTFSYYTDNPELLFDKIEWVKADILDLPSMELAFKEIDQVYHAAALISFDPRDYKLLRKVNVEGTANVVNLCIAYRIKKLCYVSTIGAIGRSTSGLVSNEENEWTEQHTNVYALSKYDAELEVWRGSQENLPVVIVNPGVILGPGHWQSGSGKLFSTAFKGYSYFPPGGTGFVTVCDVVKSMLELMDSSIVNERFILVGENLSYQKILIHLAKEFGRPKPTKQLQVWQLQIGRYVDWLKALITGSERKITKNTIYSLLHKETYSNEKIKRTLDFEFDSLNDTIELSCQKYIEEQS
ncbi:NAD-dependent epimerase [Maribacter sp. 4U21]|uniref:SDR family oxidoreductase n=1 Tax=Maribacter sp. 4U21 TaxID=1889779 RepID=UPI000C1555FE|nr:SDR family oxidoreductase [Maribacter sp. 4U21]PIB30815.1 NAD-dependent epimerase [Maribacter sp. 4U21]